MLPSWFPSFNVLAGGSGPAFGGRFVAFRRRCRVVGAAGHIQRGDWRCVPLSPFGLDRFRGASVRQRSYRLAAALLTNASMAARIGGSSVGHASITRARSGSADSVQTGIQTLLAIRVRSLPSLTLQPDTAAFPSWTSAVRIRSPAWKESRLAITPAGTTQADGVQAYTAWSLENYCPD